MLDAAAANGEALRFYRGRLGYRDQGVLPGLPRPGFAARGPAYWPDVVAFRGTAGGAGAAWRVVPAVSVGSRRARAWR